MKFTSAQVYSFGKKPKGKYLIIITI